jgi:hypothetical protein
MSLDLSKLSDAVGKVASLAQSHASVKAGYDALMKEHSDAQVSIDALTATLVAACTSPAEAVGVAAVAAALAPAPAPVAPAADPAPSSTGILAALAVAAAPK